MIINIYKSTLFFDVLIITRFIENMPEKNILVMEKLEGAYKRSGSFHQLILQVTNYLTLWILIFEQLFFFCFLLPHTNVGCVFIYHCNYLLIQASSNRFRFCGFFLFEHLYEITQTAFFLLPSSNLYMFAAR